MQPLSDRERQILNDIEAHLRHEDPKFARTVGTVSTVDSGRRRVKLAFVGFMVGLLMLFGIVAHIGWGVAGFVLMLTSAIYGGNQLKQLARDAQRGIGGQLKGGLNRFGTRWSRREDDSST